MPGMWGRLPQKDPEPLLLPAAENWKNPEDVEKYAEECLELCVSPGWAMRWDRAVKRLGCCRLNEKVISFSRYFVEAYLEKDPELIRRTVLHELAHARAWEKYHERGHGAAWQRACVELGIAGERAACACEDFSPTRPGHERKARYALCHKETGEVYRYYYRKPRLNERHLRYSYMPGQKKETLGKLHIVNLQDNASIHE